MTEHMNFWEALARAQTHVLQMRILAVARRGVTFSPNRLSVELDEPLGNVSYHVKALKEKGFVELVKTEPRRGATEHFYRGVAAVRKAKPTVGPSEEVALANLDDALFEAMGAGVTTVQIADRFAALEAREAVAA
jgi:DNA-binding transcriptional ArsR family regulator